MVNPNRPKVIRNMEKTISRIALDGLVWNKKVAKGSGTGLIFVPKELVGMTLRVILLPVDENESLSLHKKIVINNDDLRKHNAEITKAQNRREKLEKELDDKTIEEKEEPISTAQASGTLEDEDAY